MKPPELISRTHVFSGTVFEVERDRVRFEDGREVTLDLVRHRASVVLMPMPSKDELILVRQYRHAIERWIWELPAGTSDPGEDVETAARRECHEEVGLVPHRVTSLGTFFPTPGFCDEAMTFYVLEDLREPSEPAAHDEDEQLEPKTFTLKEVEAMVARGEIADMKTICGLALLRRR
jgi:ADP-ribose pyrophosphatase